MNFTTAAAWSSFFLAATAAAANCCCLFASATALSWFMCTCDMTHSYVRNKVLHCRGQMHHVPISLVYYIHICMLAVPSCLNTLCMCIVKPSRYYWGQGKRNENNLRTTAAASSSFFFAAIASCCCFSAAAFSSTFICAASAFARSFCACEWEERRRGTAQARERDRERERWCEFECVDGQKNRVTDRQGKR